MKAYYERRPPEFPPPARDLLAGLGGGTVLLDRRRFVAVRAE